MSESRNVSYISRQKEFDDRIAKESLKNPAAEKLYSKELFLMGREIGLLKSGLITEEQRMYFKTGYPGDIASSVSYRNGLERAEFFVKNNTLPPEYLETEKTKHR